MHEGLGSIYSHLHMNWVWWCMPGIPPLRDRGRRISNSSTYCVKASLDYRRACLKINKLDFVWVCIRLAFSTFCREDLGMSNIVLVSLTSVDKEM